MKISYQNNNSYISKKHLELSKDFLLSKFNSSIHSITIKNSFSDIEFESYLEQGQPILLSPDKVISIKGLEVFINIDMISLLYIFSNLLRSKKKNFFDSHKRLDISYDIYENNGLPYIDMLINYINSHYQEIEKGRIRLSMDIDHIKYPNLSLLRMIKEWHKFKKYDFPLSELFKLLINPSNAKLEHVLKYSKILKENSISGDFFFMFCHSSTNFDSGYKLDSKLQNIIKKLIDSGHRIGFHPSYYSFQNEDKFKEEFQRYYNNFGKDFMIIRNHYLRNDYNNYWDLIEKYNFKEDHSIGMSTNCGFFSGISSGFSPINESSQKKYNFKSYPLNFMDDYLFESEHFFKEFPQKISNNLLDGCDASILFHNSLFLHTNYFEKMCKLWANRMQ